MMEVCRSKRFQCRFTLPKRSKVPSKISCSYYLLEHLTYYTQIRFRQARMAKKCETQWSQGVLEIRMPRFDRTLTAFPMT